MVARATGMMSSVMYIDRRRRSGPRTNMLPMRYAPAARRPHPRSSATAIAASAAMASHRNLAPVPCGSSAPTSSIAASETGGYSTAKSRYGVPFDAAISVKRTTYPCGIEPLERSPRSAPATTIRNTIARVTAPTAACLLTSCVPIWTGENISLPQRVLPDAPWTEGPCPLLAPQSEPRPCQRIIRPGPLAFR